MSAKDSFVELNDKVVLVTGAGRNIGRAIALEMAQRGARVGVVDLDHESAESVAAEIQSVGGHAYAYKIDVSNKEQVDASVDQVTEKFGRLDVMVNNAGISYAIPFLEVTESDWDRFHAINTKGALFGTQAAARMMIDKGIEGRIINIASINAKGGRPLLAPYGASKAAVINLSQSAALALAPHKITVNCLCPGAVDTAMFDGYCNQLKDLAEAGRISEEQTHIPEAPLGLTVDPCDVARMAVFLAGEGGRYITGQAINIDGGRTMH